MYKGVIIQLSLKDPAILADFKIVNKATDGDWELYTVEATREQIEQLSHELSDGKWYAHFWQGSEVMMVFKDRVFELNFDDKSSWKPAVDYGLSIGIPAEQLNFRID